MWFCCWGNGEFPLWIGISLEIEWSRLTGGWWNDMLGDDYRGRVGFCVEGVCAYVNLIDFLGDS